MSSFPKGPLPPDLLTASYDFELPPELIATEPAARRDESRLFVFDRATDRVEHRRFSDLPDYLKPGDLLVLNNSKVRRAALTTSDGRLEALLLDETSPQHWVALVKPGARAKPGMRLQFRGRAADSPEVEAEVLKTLPGGERVLRFFGPVDLDALGEMPLPPYIRKRRTTLGQAEYRAEDAERYQTVYADRAGSVAAPILGQDGVPVASMSVCGPVERFAPNVEEFAILLLAATRDISARLGYRP